MFLKRARVPKIGTPLKFPCAPAPRTVLNVTKPDGHEMFYIHDSLKVNNFGPVKKMGFPTHFPRVKMLTLYKSSVKFKLGDFFFISLTFIIFGNKN